LLPEKHQTVTEKTVGISAVLLRLEENFGGDADHHLDTGISSLLGDMESGY